MQILGRFSFEFTIILVVIIVNIIPFIFRYRYKMAWNSIEFKIVLLFVYSIGVLLVCAVFAFGVFDFDVLIIFIMLPPNC